MKTYDERLQSILDKTDTKKKQRKKAKRIVSLSCVALAILVLGLVLFIPYDTSAPDVSMFADSPYYSLIRRINEATYRRPAYKNNFEMLVSSADRVLTDGYANKGEAMAPGSAEIIVDNTYQEVTDNQVDGIIEADLFKRSDKYIYYMRRNELQVYSIAGEASALVGTFSLGQEYTATLPVYGKAEMFLSQDCTTVTLIYPCMGTQSKTSYVCVLNLDVSDPANITQIDHVLITGAENTARMVDGQLLLLTDFYIPYNKDFSDESTFLPQIGKEGQMHSVAAGDIIAPEELSATRYTVVTLMDAKSLEVRDTAAFLSYSDAVYVSQSHIFASRRYNAEAENVRRTMTEISCLSYGDQKLELLGSAVVQGSVKNQYSMDENRGILRVVTSTNETKTIPGNEVTSAQLNRNASLWCIDMADFTVKAKVENFAPAGEQAESVRFDGDKAYVCTAEVITMTDPVYFFDLSDLSNITWKDTGTIDGYSSSLVDFGDGYLLGIGFNEMRQLKIEVYVETATAVESLCSYELPATFSQDYKSYLIDREGGYVGLAVYNYENGKTEYLLLKFDGYELRTLVQEEVTADVTTLRSVMIDGWLYILADEFRTMKIY